MLPQEQIENIKSQLISQLENSESENKEQVKKSIQMMNSEQLEQFLIYGSYPQVITAKTKTEKIQFIEESSSLAVSYLPIFGGGRTIRQR